MTRTLTALLLIYAASMINGQCPTGSLLNTQCANTITINAYILDALEQYMRDNYRL